MLRIRHQTGPASYWRREVTDPSDYSVILNGGIAITTIPLFGKF